MLIAFAFLDLYIFASSYIGWLPKKEITKEPELVTMLKENRQMYRAQSMTQYSENPYLYLGWKKNSEAILDLRKSLPPNNNISYGIPYFTDRIWLEGGLGINRRNQVENFLLQKNSDQILGNKILGMYSVKYILTFADSMGPEVYEEKEIELGKSYAGKLKVFRNDMAIPRLSFVPEIFLAEKESTALDRVLTLEHLPTKNVILEKPPKEITEEFKGALDEFKKENTLNFELDENERIQISADIKNHGFLILNDMNYPGWKVKVDGKNDTLYQANYLVRAVELFPGKHEVEFYFDPLSFKVGSIISLISLIGLISLIVLNNTRLPSKAKGRS
jgi:hypothetical protein